MAGPMAGAAGAEFPGGDSIVLRVLRIAAEDVVPHVSQPAEPGAGGSVSLHPPGVVAAGVADVQALARVAAMDRRQNVHGPLVWQPGGNEIVHAGIGAGPYFG